MFNFDEFTKTTQENITALTAATAAYTRVVIEVSTKSTTAMTEMVKAPTSMKDWTDLVQDSTKSFAAAMTKAMKV